MWLLTATCIGIGFPTILGDEPPRKSKELYADACGCMQPHAQAWISLLVSGRRVAQTNKEMHVDACGCWETHGQTHRETSDTWPIQVRKSMPMHRAACRHMLRHIFPLLFWARCRPGKVTHGIDNVEKSIGEAHTNVPPHALA